MFIATVSCAENDMRTMIASCDNRDFALHSLYNTYIRDFYSFADIMDAADELPLAEESDFRSEAGSEKGFSLMSFSKGGARIYRIQEVSA